MKFDIIVFGDGFPKLELNSISFLAVLTALLTFPRKEYKSITYTIQTSDNAEN